LALAKRHVELDPLSTRGWNNLGKAYAALGQHELARQSWEKSIGLGDPYLARKYMLADLMTTGEMDSAIEFFEANAPRIGFEREEVRSFVTSALAENSGREFLGSWIDAKIADARNYEEQFAPYVWYLYFGYLDEYWQVIESMAQESTSGWDNTGDMEHIGRVFSTSGFVAHPAYMSRSRRWGLTALWDTRGRPDTCSKDTGDWVCE